MKDFERMWHERLQKALDRVTGKDTRKQIMSDSNNLLENYSTEKAIKWTQKTINKLEESLEKEEVADIITSCACHYPHEKLQDFKELYAKTRDIDMVHKLLQENFEKEIKIYKNLNDEQLRMIIDKGWGVAGIKEGNIIYATKIPSRFHEYFQSTNEKEKRYNYCHCPKIRDFIEIDESLSVNYCYCGAGFYTDIWQEILQNPVKIEIVSSLLKGDDVCKFKIILPL